MSPLCRVTRMVVVARLSTCKSSILMCSIMSQYRLLLSHSFLPYYQVGPSLIDELQAFLLTVSCSYGSEGTCRTSFRINRSPINACQRKRCFDCSKAPVLRESLRSAGQIKNVSNSVTSITTFQRPSYAQIQTSQYPSVVRRRL